jgi:hypothetical protein
LIPVGSVPVGIYADLCEHVGLQVDTADTGNGGLWRAFGSWIVGRQNHRPEGPCGCTRGRRLGDRTL